ncbi:MAG TPA: MucB/RseB C-terminal domain-containing protein [Rhodocyclaceae bacterium]|nr:MucB/RseB C-terminal domain-containing protein [Rhodocyclaceae bacterium]HRQ48297.1 MucB/RseB C-terminal domain-containing protein [Rhodocyclaceae bacterium]
MNRIALVLVACALLVPVHTIADDRPSDPIFWLSKIATAAQRLNYTGTFIYQSGKDFETSRITHMVDASGEHERLEVLDGSPREVIRSQSEVRCVLPDQKIIIIDRAGGQRAFPARLPSSYAGLSENYRVSMGEVSRVAGYDTQLIVLEPRDGLRYGHMLWADMGTGLLLKARTIDERGEIIEQFAFSDVRIGGEIDPNSLKPSYAEDGEWRVINAHGSEVSKAESGWMLAAPLPGYSLKSVVRRPLGRDRGDILHLAFSDGLAAISVFIEPVEADRPRNNLGALANGAINIYRRIVNEHLVTALGEVPLLALQRLGDGIEPVR